MAYAGGVLAVIPILSLLASSSDISEHCHIHDGVRIVCKCVSDEEFILPEGFDYRNITSLSLSSCSSANLHFSSINEAAHLEELIVQSIKGPLNFDLFLTTTQLKTLKLLDTGRIPTVTHDTFLSLNRIELFEIRNAVIDYFEEEFNDALVVNFVMVNVTIERIKGWNFSQRGTVLRLIDCDFRNINTSLNFAYFQDVVIINSKFEFSRPGHLLIDSATAVVDNSVFLNASMNIVANSSIRMSENCADGKSSVRLSSKNIESYGNRWPTEIVYTRSKQVVEDTTVFLNRNNTVCIAGNCKCPKRNGESIRGPQHAMTLVLTILLLNSL